MLETFQVREQLQRARQELAHALYQHDAAARVIARLTRERDDSNAKLESLRTQVESGKLAVDAASASTVQNDADQPDAKRVEFWVGKGWCACRRSHPLSLATTPSHDLPPLPRPRWA